MEARPLRWNAGQYALTSRNRRTGLKAKRVRARERRVSLAPRARERGEPWVQHQELEGHGWEHFSDKQLSNEAIAEAGILLDPSFNDGSHDPHEDHNHTFAPHHHHRHEHFDASHSSALERGLRVVLTRTGVHALAERLHGRLWVVLLAWGLMGTMALCNWSYSMLGTNAWQPLKWISGLCVGMVYLLVGTPELADVLPQIAKGDIDTHVLTSAAVFGTIFLGCAAEGALLLSLFATAHAVEDRATKHAQGDLRALWDSVPTQANLISESGSDEELGEPDMVSARRISATDVPVGALLLVKAGEQVPLDGDVVGGSALVSLERITGESLPVRKRRGDEVPAGAGTSDGALVIRTQRLASDSTPARIARLTENAQRKRPTVQAFLDRAGGIYSRAVLLATVVAMAAGPLLGLPLLGRGGAIYRAFAFLSAAAPCALLMAPLAYVAAIASSAKRGALVRGGITLDALSDCYAVCLDKTGTLTAGVLECTSVEPKEAEPWALAVAAALERRVKHPMAQAVLDRASAYDSNLANVQVESFRAVQGQGVEGSVQVDGFDGVQNVRFGSISFVNQGDADSIPDVPSHVSDWYEVDGQQDPEIISVLDGLPCGRTTFRFSDRVHGSSSEAVKDLRAQGYEVSVLTGDDRPNALSVARNIGIPPESVYSSLSPSDKLHKVAEVKESMGKGNIMMVGDGINDAPALASADVGVAVAATPSEAAASAADVLLLHRGVDVIQLLPGVLRIAKRTRAVMVQNLVLACLSVLGTSLPALGGAVPLWLAVLLHEGTTILVAANSLRLLLPEPGPRMMRMAAFLSLGAFTAAAACVAPLRNVVVSSFSFAAQRAAEIARSAWAGLLAGCLHTLTGALPRSPPFGFLSRACERTELVGRSAGPDHLAALAPLTIGRSRTKSTLLGGLWGCGHNTGQIVTGLAFLVLRDKLPFKQSFLETCSQAVVGFTLILIGILGIKEGREAPESARSHLEGASFPEGGAVLGPESALSAVQSNSKRFIWGTYVTGLVHGLQPDALLVLLPALTLPTASATSYLASFLIGTVAAMAAYTYFLGAGTEKLMRRAPWMTGRISMLSSFIALGIGACLALCAYFGIQPFD